MTVNAAAGPNPPSLTELQKQAASKPEALQLADASVLAEVAVFEEVHADSERSGLLQKQVKDAALERKALTLHIHHRRCIC